MLVINIPSQELFDSKTSSFINTKEHSIQLEHSLISISKWESKWKKPFISNDIKTNEETLDYIKCMLLDDKDNAYISCLTENNIKSINDYIGDPMTATTFHNDESKGRRDIITSELIYYWMIASNIPMECEKWHLNRLLTLIRICSIKNAPPKKMSKREIIERNRVLNEARKKKLHTNG